MTFMSNNEEDSFLSQESKMHEQVTGESKVNAALSPFFHNIFPKVVKL